MEIFKSNLDVVLDTLFGVTLLSRGWARWTQRSLPTSPILSFCEEILLENVVCFLYQTELRHKGKVRLRKKPH